MGSGDMVIAVHPDKARKMMSAYKRGKGLRIQMDAQQSGDSALLPRDLVSQDDANQDENHNTFLAKLKQVAQ